MQNNGSLIMVVAGSLHRIIALLIAYLTSGAVLTMPFWAFRVRHQNPTVPETRRACTDEYLPWLEGCGPARLCGTSIDIDTL